MTVMGEPMEQKRLPLVLLFVADAGGGVADAMVESGGGGGEWRVEKIMIMSSRQIEESISILNFFPPN